MSERNVNRREGSDTRYSATRTRCSRGDDHGRFASEFNHFGDGLGVPVPELLQRCVLVEFLRFHYWIRFRTGD